MTIPIRRTLRGALIVTDPSGSRRSIVFQYNPEHLSRKLQPQTLGGDSNSRSAPFAFSGAPIETIQAQIDVDASDQVDLAEDVLRTAGIQPLLEAIETILYPASTAVATSMAQLNAGLLEIGNYRAPTVIFSWGERVAPVRITSYSVTEQAFSGELRPIRAQIDLELQVLRYSDVLPSDPAFQEFAAYHRAKERLARLGSKGGA